MTEIGFLIGRRIDSDGVARRDSERPAAHSSTPGPPGVNSIVGSVISMNTSTLGQRTRFKPGELSFFIVYNSTSSCLYPLSGF